MTGSGQLGFSLKPDTDGGIVNYRLLQFEKRTKEIEEDFLLTESYVAKRFSIIEKGSFLKNQNGRETINQKCKKKNLPAGSYLKAGSILDSGSDLDFAIVNSECFEKIGNELYSRLISNHFDLSLWSKHKDFCKYYFKGWIRPDYLPDDYSYSEQLKKYFMEKSLELGISGINVAIYRSWKYLLFYHQSNIQKIKTKIISL